MEIKEENHLVLRVIEYGINNKEFFLKDLYSGLKLDSNDSLYVYKHLVCYAQNEPNPNHILKTVNAFASHGNPQTDLEYHFECRVLPTAIFSYIDHQEIIEARKSATEAKRLSWIAIWISTGIGLGSLVVGLIQVLITLK